MNKIVYTYYTFVAQIFNLLKNIPFGFNFWLVIFLIDDWFRLLIAIRTVYKKDFEYYLKIFNLLSIVAVNCKNNIKNKTAIVTLT